MIHIRADRCIDLNDHGQLRGRAVAREAADGRSRYRSQGLRPQLRVEGPGPGQRRTDHRPGGSPAWAALM
jgi:hypothetical protein